MEHAFTWYSLIPGIRELPHYVVSTSVIALLTLIVGVLGAHAIKRAQDVAVPDEKLTLRNFLELTLQFLIWLAESALGHEGKRFLPLIGSLFLYIFISNLMGLIPGFLPPTDNINTNLACALLVFCFYNLLGFRTHGIKYIKHFMGPIMGLAVLMFPIEVFSHFVRVGSLSIRLFGNINGDHMVLTVFKSLSEQLGDMMFVPLSYVPSLLIPVFFFALGLLVSFIQALVFSLLSSLYISMAISHDH
jgi:F-type H+-transporting ATPase subunit a